MCHVDTSSHDAHPWRSAHSPGSSKLKPYMILLFQVTEQYPVTGSSPPQQLLQHAAPPAMSTGNWKLKMSLPAPVAREQLFTNVRR
jgi:hypothetical protein